MFVVELARPLKFALMVFFQLDVIFDNNKSEEDFGLSGYGKDTFKIRETPEKRERGNHESFFRKQRKIELRAFDT